MSRRAVAASGRSLADSEAIDAHCKAAAVPTAGDLFERFLAAFAVNPEVITLGDLKLEGGYARWIPAAQELAKLAAESPNATEEDHRTFQVIVDALQQARRETPPLVGLPAVTRAVFDAILADRAQWKALRSGAPYYGDRAGEHVVLAETDPTATLAAEQQAALWRVVQALDEETVQLVLFIVSRCLGAGEPVAGAPTYVDFHVGESLAFRGYAPHHKGGFRSQHKRAERDRIAALARFWMPIHGLPDVPDPEPPKKKGRTPKRTRYGPFLSFEVVVDGDVADGPAALPLFDLPNDARMVPYSFSVALGRWATPLLLNSSHLRPAFAGMARYRADRSREERFALRIALALTFGWSAAQYASQTWDTMRELLEAARITIPKKHPGEFREDVERAFQRLLEDRIIASIPGYAFDRDDGRPFAEWLKSPATFWAPPTIRAFFAAQVLPLA